MKLRRVPAEKAWPTRTASGRMAKAHMGAGGRPLCGALGAVLVLPLTIGGPPPGRRTCRLCRRSARTIMRASRQRPRSDRGIPLVDW